MRTTDLSDGTARFDVSFQCLQCPSTLQAQSASEGSCERGEEKLRSPDQSKIIPGSAAAVQAEFCAAEPAVRLDWLGFMFDLH